MEQEMLPSLHQTDQVSSTALRQWLDTVSADQTDENGNTYLHKLVPLTELPTPVYIFASAGVPVNAVNKVGESALHLAVKANKHMLVEALLQCGADPNLADKIGVTPSSLCSSLEMTTTMNRFQPGLHQAIMSGDFGAVCKLLKNWVSVSSKFIDSGKSAFDLTTTKFTSDVYVLKCVQKVRDSRNQLLLIHAVLSDDVEKARMILKKTKMRSANSRYRGERSLLSIAIENRNTDMVELLLNDGVKTNGRVRHRQLKATDFVPCVLLAYSCQPDVSVAQLLWNYGIHALHERDTEGNTALIRAIIHGASLSFVQWYVTVTHGQTIARRNKAKLTAYEVAEKLGRTDITSFINKYIEEHFNQLEVPLLVQFYGSLHPKLAPAQRKFEVNATALFKAACVDDEKSVDSLNLFNYQDRNGFTALHRAVASGSLSVIRRIDQTRPVLKGIADNVGRFPLHLAFLLPEDGVREEVLAILLQSNAESYEYACDMNGKNPADFLHLPDEVKRSMLKEVVRAEP